MDQLNHSGKRGGKKECICIIFNKDMASRF